MKQKWVLIDDNIEFELTFFNIEKRPTNDSTPGSLKLKRWNSKEHPYYWMIDAKKC